MLAALPLIAGMHAAAPVADAAGQAGAGDSRAAALERQLGPGVRAEADDATGWVRFVGADKGRPVERTQGIGASTSPQLAAKTFLDRYGAYFGLPDGSRGLRVETVRGAPHGRASVRLRQLHEGVPVLGGELVVNLNRDRDVLSASGEASPRPSLGTEPGVSAAAARLAALEAIAKARSVPPSRLRATAPELWIYDSRLLGGPGPRRPLLVWRLDVSAHGGPIRELVLVDAQLGSVALHFDQIADALDREVCDAGNTVSDYPCTAALSERSEGDPPTGSADVNNAYDYAGDTYDFYFDRFGRDSLDDAGMSLLSTVRYCPSGSPCPYQNAYWDGQQMAYGQGFASADDVVGHELTHGVTEFSSHLFYYYQSGAINESLSDVFGELIDLSNSSGTDTAAARWLVGEDIPGIGAIRDMQDPPAFGDPDRITSPNYTADSSEADSGGVHANSGVNNKAAYLMTDGDSFNGFTVTGLGIDKAARIYYEAQTNLLTSASDYADLGSALEQACSNLIGTGGISGADCAEVADTVGATEMEQDPPTAPAPEAPICGSGSPADSFFDNLETPSSGNWALTTTVGTNEWYYPQNSNPYGFDATYATSGTTNLWGYDRPATGDYSIRMTSSVTVPANGFMRFSHAFGFEDTISPLRRWDGGVVEYSTNGGSSWNDAGPLFADNGYNGTLTSSGSTNPLRGRSAFVAESNGYVSSRIDLSSLAGQQVRFRFRLGTDSSVDDYGWFIDDVRIYGCNAADNDPPETTITAGPSGPSNDSTPSFAFSSDEPGSSLECRFDPDPFAACSGPGATHTPSSALGEGTHTFEVRATDPAANTDPTPASRAFTVDTQVPAAPSVTDTDPDSPSADNNPEVKGSAEAGSTVRLYESGSCAGAVEAQGSAASFASPGLTAAVTSNATATFTATATDAAGNVSGCSSASVDYVEDSNPPPAPSSLAVSPASLANNNSPQVSGSAETGSTVKVYKAPTPSDCTPGNLAATGTQASFSSPGLAASVSDDTTTTFRATATDTAGNTSACSSGVTYVEDSAPPAAPSALTSSPISPANDNGPRISGSAEAGSTVKAYTTVGCTGSSEATGTAANFSSPGLTATVLDNSTNTFKATATDAAGNVSPCSSSSVAYQEDSTIPAAPTLTATSPASPANHNSPGIRGSAEAGSTVKLYTDPACTAGPAGTGTATTFASTGITVAVADDSTTTFYATATDVNTSACSPTSVIYVEDSTPPAASIDSGPSGVINEHAPTFAFSSEPAAVFQCSVDTGTPGFGACSGPGNSHTPSAALSDGTYTFRVRATDQAGNIGAAATRTFTIVTPTSPDLSPPETTITKGPRKKTRKRRPSFAFAASEPGSSFQCQLDSGPFQRCTSPFKPQAKLTFRKHIFRVEAIDPANNVDATPAVLKFKIIRGP